MQKNPTFLATALAAAMLVSTQGFALGQGTTDLPETMTDAGPRFELLRQGDGYVRLDRQTGEMSYCAIRSANLTCRLAGEEREAYLRQIGELEDRLARLEQRIEDLSATPRTDEKEMSGKDKGLRVPSPEREREFDEAVEFAERALRRFFDVVKELREQIEEESPSLR